MSALNLPNKNSFSSSSSSLILSEPKTQTHWSIPTPSPHHSNDGNKKPEVSKAQTDSDKSQESSSSSSFVVLSRASNPNSLTILDNRTHQTYHIPIHHGAIDAVTFLKMTDLSGTGGIRMFDPSFMNTAVAYSKITEIDGAKGILRYRGYPIEELAEKSSFLEVAFLLIFGELPSKSQFAEFEHEVLHHTFVHSKFSDLMKCFNYDAHPMGMFISAIAAMSTFHPEANPALNTSDLYKTSPEIRNNQIFRLLGKSITMASMSYRHRIGRPYNSPPEGMGYTETFLYMLDHLSEHDYQPNPKLARALDILFILHADHELNCSTATMRHVSSSSVDVYSAISASASALYGPLHGGANEAVVRMLQTIGHPSNVPKFLEKVRNKQAKLMGFGHRIYRNYDPRAKIIRKVAYDVFDIVGREPLIEVAIELEKAALLEPYFVERKLFPNVDFYSGIIYKAMGFPLDFFPVLFALPRIAGWLAHWVEQLEGTNQKIWRPRQIYTGEGRRNYVPMEYREENDAKSKSESFIRRSKHPFHKRTAAASFSGKQTFSVPSKL